jgi:uncharacterized protein YcnI
MVIAFVSSLGFLAGATGASAHAVLDQWTAPAGSYYKGVITATHGCKGSPTHTVRIQIPLNVRGAMPMPKYGWDLEIVVKTLDEPYESYGRTITEDVRELIWRGGPLPNEYIDEFVFQVKLPEEAGQVVYFKTIQECEEGFNRWIEIPEPGQSSWDLEAPAPGLTLTKGEGH